MMKKQNKHLNMQKHWEETESFAWKELQVEIKNYTYCCMNLYVWSHLETINCWINQQGVPRMTQKFIYSILYCVIFSGYHRHIDNCTREMSKFLLDQIKKIKHSPMESIAADWKILDVPKLLELSRVFGKVRDVFC